MYQLPFFFFNNSRAIMASIIDHLDTILDDSHIKAFLLKVV